MKFIYRLNARGPYFKMIITSIGTEQTNETFIGMYDFPIKQCYARGIYVNNDGMVMQRGLVFLCAFPGKTLNIMETAISISPDGDTTEIPNEFYFNDEQMSMHMFFENILMNTGL